MKLEELIECKKEDSIDKVCIRVTPVSTFFLEKRKEKKRVGFFEDGLWIDIVNVATYIVYEGNKIYIMPYERATSVAIKTYLLCSCLGFIMIQKGRLAIHGSALVAHNKAFIITGDKGAGKSTLVSAFIQKGYQFLSDDVCAVHEEHPISIYSGFPYQRLLEDTMKALKYDLNAATSFYGDGQILKYNVNHRKAFELEEKEVKTVIELYEDSIAEVTLSHVKGQEKVLRLFKNIYRGYYLEKFPKMRAQYLDKCILLAKNITYYQLTRPKNKFSVVEQIKIIEDNLI